MFISPGSQVISGPTEGRNCRPTSFSPSVRDCRESRVMTSSPSLVSIISLPSRAKVAVAL